MVLLTAGILILVKNKDEIDVTVSLTYMSNHDRISPYNINTNSRRQVMRTEKSVN